MGGTAMRRSPKPQAVLPAVDAQETQPFRVLCLDGGGMRGAYQAAYLSTFADRLCESLKRGDSLDIGTAFDLVVGTSTGGIVACGLAAGIPLRDIQTLYAKAGGKMFPMQWARPLPVLGKLVKGLGTGKRRSDRPLRNALTSTLGDQ